MRSLNDYMFSESVEMQLLKKESDYRFSDCNFYTIRDRKAIVQLVKWLEKHKSNITMRSCAGELCFTIEAAFFHEKAVFSHGILGLISFSLSYDDKIHLIFKSPYTTNEECLC